MSDTHTLLKSATDQFREAMLRQGITPPESIEGDGNVHRFSSNGKPDDDAGWYVFHNGDMAIGAFGDFRTGQFISSWEADSGRILSRTEKASLRTKQEEIRVKRQNELAERRIKAKEKAAGILKISKPAQDDHPYLVRKGVGSYGLRIWKDLLVVPLYDGTDAPQSVQLIAPNGDKKFLSGGKTQGCYFPIGNLNNADTILIAEGYATAATIHVATGHPVVVAFNAGNLVAVSKVIRAQYSGAAIFLCADDDTKTEGNPGLTKATEAARAIGGSIIVPKFGEGRPNGATDFNDMAAHLGKEAVARFFTANFVKRPDKPTEPDAADCLNGPEAVICRPQSTASAAPTLGYYAEQSERATPAAALHPASPRSYAGLKNENAAQPELHFPTETFEVVSEIWKNVPRRTSCHSKNGYHLTVDDERKVIITQDRIEFAHKPKHRLDQAYAAACEHARHFWNGQMEVHGDRQHCVKAWAYAKAYGIQVANFTPSNLDLIEVEKMMKLIRKNDVPTFSASKPIRPGAPHRPSAGLNL
jgi:phage/plasmid primase-like uncharacterized protein